MRPATVPLLLLAAALVPAQRDVSLQPLQGRRMALLIGNSAYPRVAELKNAANDASSRCAAFQ